MVVKVRTSKRFEKEKGYLFSFLLEECLGLNSNLEYSSENRTSILFESGFKLIFPEYFFEQAEKSGGFLTKDQIPTGYDLSNSLKERRIPSIPFLFGEGKLDWTEKEVRFGWDLFGTCFFYLAFIPELVLDQKDPHRRFTPLDYSGLYDLPVVDHQINLLAQVASIVEPEIKSPSKDLVIRPSIDIDHPEKFRGFKGEIKKALGSLRGDQEVKGEPYLERAKELVGKMNSLGFCPDLFFLIKADDENRSQIDGIKRLLKSLEGLKFNALWHPSYMSMDLDKALLEDEKIKFEGLIGTKCNSSRQHYLRYEYPLTFQKLREIGIENDHSVGWSTYVGFRAGTTRSFPLFDPLKREALGIREFPLALMDRSFMRKEFLNDPRKVRKELNSRIDKIMKVGGELNILFHNSTFDEPGGSVVNDLFMEICEHKKLKHEGN